MFILPTPWDLKPHDFEVPPLANTEGCTAERRQWIEQTLAEWQARPGVRMPASLDAWVELVRGSRGRGISTFGHWPVGGKIYITSLERGASATLVLLEYDTTEEQMLNLVGYTLNPLAQLRPCWCGSERSYLDCHLALQADNPCRCGSGEKLVDCCLLGFPD